jgi:hypothetical protein
LAFGFASARSEEICKGTVCFDYQPLPTIVCTLPPEPLPPDPEICIGALTTQPPLTVVAGTGVGQSGRVSRAKAKVRLALQGKRPGKRWVTLEGPVKTRGTFNFVWRTPADSSGSYQLRLAVLKRDGGVRFAFRKIAEIRIVKRKTEPPPR